MLSISIILAPFVGNNAARGYPITQIFLGNIDNE
jgi:hypothetical protein